MSKRTQKSIQTLPTSRALQAVDAAFDLRFDLRLQCLRALRAIDAHHALAKGGADCIGAAVELGQARLNRLCPART